MRYIKKFLNYSLWGGLLAMQSVYAPDQNINIPPSGPGGSKLGVVNVQTILQGCKAFRAKQMNLEKKIQAAQVKLKAQDEELMTKIKQLNSLQGSLPLEKFQAREAELRKKYEAFQAQVADQNKKFRQEADTSLMELQNQVQAAIAMISSKYSGLSVVFDKQFILWVNENTLDITQEVLDMLNNAPMPSAVPSSKPIMPKPLPSLPLKNPSVK